MTEMIAGRYSKDNLHAYYEGIAFARCTKWRSTVRAFSEFGAS
ncbi:hypothetical protein [Pontibacter amylolyticus]|nr:hypothetical protein [Pontibacter amylolyticus]